MGLAYSIGVIVGRHKIVSAVVAISATVLLAISAGTPTPATDSRKIAAAAATICTTGLQTLASQAQALLKAGKAAAALDALSTCATQLKTPPLKPIHDAAIAAQARQAAADKKADLARRRKEGVTIGMTAEEVVQSNWGRPRKINRTVRADYVHEQYVYDGGYLYLTNGRLTSIQN